MKDLFSHNVILIDLTGIKNTMFKDLLEDNGLGDSISPEMLLAFKKDGYNKLWVDKQTLEIIAYIFNGSKEITINERYVSFLKKIKPISLKKESNEVVENYTVDSILDKISINGMESLSKKELNFLKRNSK